MGNNPSKNRGDDLPVEDISWYDANNFCQKVSEKLKVTCRLPTEAEWEYACGAGTATRTDCESARKPGAACATDTGATPSDILPVKSGSANAWGLYDTHGNVWEWVDGSLDYAAGPDSKRPTGSGQICPRILRGGPTDDGACLSRSAPRF